MFMHINPWGKWRALAWVSMIGAAGCNSQNSSSTSGDGAQDEEEAKTCAQAAREEGIPFAHCVTFDEVQAYRERLYVPQVDDFYRATDEQVRKHFGIPTQVALEKQPDQPWIWMASQLTCAQFAEASGFGGHAMIDGRIAFDEKPGQKPVTAEGASPQQMKEGSCENHGVPTIDAERCCAYVDETASDETAFDETASDSKTVQVLASAKTCQDVAQAYAWGEDHACLAVPTPEDETDKTESEPNAEVGEQKKSAEEALAMEGLGFGFETSDCQRCYKKSQVQKFKEFVAPLAQHQTDDCPLAVVRELNVYSETYGGFHLGEDWWHGAWPYITGQCSSAGQNVLSLSSGRVVYAGYNGSSYNRTVIIEHLDEHGESICSGYGHLEDELLVKAGELVERGKPIARVIDPQILMQRKKLSWWMPAHVHVALTDAKLCQQLIARATGGFCGYGSAEGVRNEDGKLHVPGNSKDCFEEGTYLSPSEYIKAHPQQAVPAQP